MKDYKKPEFEEVALQPEGSILTPGSNYTQGALGGEGEDDEIG